MNVNTSSSDSSDEDGPPVEQIPGFYYDRKKKKYFKIQTQAYNPQGSLTSEALLARKTKKKMKKLRREIETAKSKTCSSSTPHLFSQMQLHGCDNSMVSAIQKRRLRSWTATTFIANHYSASLRAALLAKNGVMYGLQLSPYYSIICWNYGNPQESIKRLCNSDRESYDCCMTECRSHGSDAVLVARTKARGLSTDLRLIRKAGKAYSVTYELMRGKFENIGDVCSTSSHPYVFVTNTDVLSKVTIEYLDLSKRARVSRYETSVTPSCLAVHPTCVNAVYCGSKEGDISITDFRARPNRSQLYSYQINRQDRQTRITSMIALNDGNTIAVSHITGMRSLLDTRMCKLVVFNKEFMEDNCCDRSVLKIDETGQYLTSSGLKGGFVPIWDPKTLNTVKIMKVEKTDNACYCEISTRDGYLKLLTMDGISYTIYS